MLLYYTFSVKEQNGKVFSYKMLKKSFECDMLKNAKCNINKACMCYGRCNHNIIILVEAKVVIIGCISTADSSKLAILGYPYKNYLRSQLWKLYTARYFDRLCCIFYFLILR